MGGFNLPMPPQIGAPSGNSGGGLTGPMSGPNTLPYQPPVASSLVQGIAQFMQQFNAQRDQEKQRASSDAERDIKMLQLGLPVNLKKTAANMKRAGINLDFESESPMSPATGGAGSPAAGMQLPGGPAGPGITVPPTAGAPPPGIPSQQFQPPSGFQRVMQAFGAPASINPNSPGMAALQNMRQQGMQQQQIQTQQMQNQGQLQQIVGAALQNDPKATELATRFGLAHSLPGDEWFRMGHMQGLDDETIAKQQMWIAMGGPAMRKELISMADKNKDSFGGKMDQALQYYSDVMNKGSSSIEPTMSFDEQMKIADHALKLQELHPTMPFNVAMTTALSVSQGDSATSDKLRQFVASKFPTKGQVDWTKWSTGMDMDMQKMRIQQAQFAQSHELAVANAAREALGSQFDEFSKLANDKSSSQETRNSALQGMVDALNKKGALKVTLPGGQKISLGASNLTTERVSGWTHPLTSLNQAMGNVMGDSPLNLQYKQMLGNPATANNPNAMMNMFRQMLDVPVYIQGDEADAYRKEQMQKLRELLGSNQAGVP